MGVSQIELDSVKRAQSEWNLADRRGERSDLLELNPRAGSANLEMNHFTGGALAGLAVEWRPRAPGRPDAFPFPPGFGSSIRPSIPLAKNPSG